MKTLITTTAAAAIMASVTAAHADNKDNERYDAVTPETTLNDTGVQIDDNARYDAVTPDQKLNDTSAKIQNNERYKAVTPGTEDEDVSRNYGTEFERVNGRTQDEMTRSEYLKETLR
ncbi:hypothetical protein [Neptunicoccus cionae]|uniref:Uncharacterized protein n=1 Tax=Neptunicoccus cionae TaxID=2035344 RepID=A0A916VSU4_9RHOB|nr:hypothetical protein [Amylibacter cionae]GGA30481.1 hypothetical protein GCM10011498_34580 [Amylibacter cionae]